MLKLRSKMNKNNSPQQIHIADYDYPLPDEQIAKYPLAERDHSKLLVYRHGEISEDVFYHLPRYIDEGELMVFNNTKVIQARLHFQKLTGANIEIFLLEPANPTDYELIFQTHGCCDWYCMIGNLKKWKDGAILLQTDDLSISATRIGENATSYQVHFEWTPDTLSFAEVIDRVGELPIPPYLNRDTEESDKTTYQTVYSKIQGSVAAPTAGLHFTEQVLTELRNKPVTLEEVTLHVGAGTFKPVKSDVIAQHDMHVEYFSVSLATIRQLLQHQGKAIAVGTTSVRTLESLYYIGAHLLNSQVEEADTFSVKQWEPYETSTSITAVEALQAIEKYLIQHQLAHLNGSTRIIIAPSYEFKIVKTLITNFHQPKSTLLLLVSAFLQGDWKSIYQFALQRHFRFLSYGDSSILIP